MSPVRPGAWAALPAASVGPRADDPAAEAGSRDELDPEQAERQATEAHRVDPVGPAPDHAAPVHGHRHRPDAPAARLAQAEAELATVHAGAPGGQPARARLGRGRARGRGGPTAS